MGSICFLGLGRQQRCVWRLGKLQKVLCDISLCMLVLIKSARQTQDLSKLRGEQRSLQTIGAGSESKGQKGFPQPLSFYQTNPDPGPTLSWAPVGLQPLFFLPKDASSFHYQKGEIFESSIKTENQKHLFLRLKIQSLLLSSLSFIPTSM